MNAHARGTLAGRVAAHVARLVAADEPADTIARPAVEAQETDIQEAPWAPVPLDDTEDFLARFPDASIEVVFPTVFEEDRTAKIKDLVQAEAIGVITHKHMAEQYAKELGIEDYDYEAEQAEIRREMPAMPQGGGLGIGDPLAQGMPGIGPAPRGLPGTGPPPSQVPGVAADAGQPRRAELSGPAQASFRRQQREAMPSTVADAEARVRRARAALADIARAHEPVAGSMGPLVDLRTQPGWQQARRELRDAQRALTAARARAREAAMRAEIDSLRADVKALREAFDPNQPREPAGGAGGGQWTAGGGGAGASGAERAPGGHDDVAPGRIDRNARPTGDRTPAAIKPPTDEERAYLAELAQDPDVQRARAAIAATVPTAQLYKHDGQYTPEREALHQRIVDALLNPEAVAPVGTKPVASIVLGPPASGKSEVLVPQIRDLDKATLIDNDKVKGLLPEFAGGLTAAAVQEESAEIGEGKLLGAAMRQRHNIVLDMVGRTTSKAVDIVKGLVAAGYEVDVYGIRNPPLQSARRAMARFKKRGRFVPPEYIIESVDHRPAVTYEALRDTGLLRSWEEYDNDVPKGTPARLIDRGRRRGAR